MKTALLHYWLTNMRGGEKVLAALGEMFPGADIFTHAYVPENVPCFNGFKVMESFIAKLPLGRKHPQAYLPLLPAATRALKPRPQEHPLLLAVRAGRWRLLSMVRRDVFSPRIPLILFVQLLKLSNRRIG